jgi:hypothetical protein
LHLGATQYEGQELVQLFDVVHLDTTLLSFAQTRQNMFDSKLLDSITEIGSLSRL